jgi:hypothetical protein
MGHLYVESKNDRAIDAWLQWAKGSEVSAELQSFASYKSDVWHGPKSKNQLEELGFPTPRSFVMADKLWRMARELQGAREQAASKGEDLPYFETQDIILPVMAGCVGATAATEMLGWFQVCAGAPKLEEIIKDPTGCKLPDQHGIFFALGITIAKDAKKQPARVVDAYCSYVARWPKEQASAGFNYLLAESEKTASSPHYLSWQAANK